MGLTLTLEYLRLFLFIEVGVTMLKYLLLDILVILSPLFLLSCFPFNNISSFVYYFINPISLSKTHFGLYSLWDTSIFIAYFGPLKVRVISSICLTPIISSLLEYKNTTGTLELISLRFNYLRFNPCNS
jgi:hypothetical protein